MARLVVIGAVLFLCVFIPMNAVQEEWDNDALELGAAEGVDGVEGSEHVQPFVDDDSEGAVPRVRMGCFLASRLTGIVTRKSAKRWIFKS